jgi:uncharacterized protein YebE (UPF0316 family)
MNWYLVVYFIAGIVQDFLFTLNVKYVAKDRIIPAVVFSFATVLVSMLVLYSIITKLDSERSIVAIIVYSTGIACGTFLAMKLKFGAKGKN